MKCDAEKGIRLSRLPTVLIFILNRFEIDYEKFERVKINSKLYFPYALDMKTYLNEDN